MRTNKMTANSISLEIDPSILEQNMRIVKETSSDEHFPYSLDKVQVPWKPVKPSPGFCVKTISKTDNKKVFVNICTTHVIPCPRLVSNKQLMEILNSSDPSSYRVPMSIGEGRTELDKSGTPCTVYDVAINNEFFKMVEFDVLFQTFFLTVVFEGLQDKYQCELDVKKSTVLKNRKSIGTLQAHRIQLRDIKNTETALEYKAPLIEEICEKPSKKQELYYRMTREPPIGEIQYLIAEFRIPASVDCKDLNLEVGEDRLVLHSKEMYELVDFYLPCSVDQECIDAQLNRNDNMLIVKMPVIV